MNMTLMVSAHYPSHKSFFRTSRKMTFVEMDELSTFFTSYPSIFMVIIMVSSCGQVTCSISDSKKEITTLPSFVGRFPATVVPEI